MISGLEGTLSGRPRSVRDGARAGAVEMLVAARRGGLAAAVEATDPILQSLVTLD